MKNLVYLLVIAGLITGTWNLKGCFEKKQKAPIVQYINPLSDTVTHYRDLYNAEHAQVQIEINGHAAIDKMHAQKEDSLCKRLHLRDKQIEDMTDLYTQAQGQFQTVLQPVYIRDTITGINIKTAAQSFAWHDDYLAESGIIDSNTIAISYLMTLPFSTTTYWKRKHHMLGIGWGKKIYYLDGFCKNPQVSITGLHAIKIN